MSRREVESGALELVCGAGRRGFPANLQGLRACLVLLVLACLACGGDDTPAPPSVVAQGFDLAETRESRIGEAVSLRLRVEAPAGIESFRVRERSYDVDLGRSPEASHFPLFGLSRRVWSKTDVTVDFGPYVAQKMGAPGDYAFELEVTDRKEQSTKATLRLRLLAVEDEEDDETEGSEAGAAASERGADDRGASMSGGSGPPGGDAASASRAALRAGDFRLERVGPGPVASSDPFGITWKTIESNQVVIRIVGTEGRASRFARLEPGAFAAIETLEDLTRALDGIGLESSTELAMANGAAAGAEIAVVQSHDRYLLRADRSETHLSELGTTVTLTGRYKR